MPTRIVGPWRSKTDRDGVYRSMIPSTQSRSRKFRFRGLYWLEIWPMGAKPGDNVQRAPMPGLAALPPLLYRPSPNRRLHTFGRRITGIVWHETQGSYMGAVSWLTNPVSRVSAHLVLNEYGTECTQTVPYSDVAWHAAGANGHTIGVELAGYEAHANDARQIKAAARIGAALSVMFDIPPVIGNAWGHGGHVTHEMLGSYGGGHHDPGGFDFEKFVARIGFEVRAGGLDLPYGRR